MKVLITGASRGIGKEIADVFKENGHQIYGPTRDELDLADEQSVMKFVELNKGKTFDVIVNNAGINELDLIENITDENIDLMMNINLISPIKLLRGFVPAMKRQKFGRIVNIGSIWAVVSKERRALYSATKNGIHGITNTLAVELAQDNILVNTVCPGFTLDRKSVV